jgi:hypothetical protein
MLRVLATLAVATVLAACGGPGPGAMSTVAGPPFTPGATAAW